jgi:hypothetical protein
MESTTFGNGIWLRNGLVVREECLKSGIEEAVLKAADEWVSAQEALMAVQQGSDEPDDEQYAADLAGSRLVVAVTRWRSSRVEVTRCVLR